MHKGSTRALALVSLLVFSTTLAVITPSAGAESALDIEVLDTKVNPANNHTYHLLSASSWTDAAQAARGLEGFLVTVDDETENTWLHDTWGDDGNVTRHLWTGLNDAAEEGVFRWHDGTPFLHRQWGQDQPSMTDVEDYVHITGPNMGSLAPGEWNDLENDPQYFPVYGVVEIGPGADFALRFDGNDDHVMTDDDSSLKEPATSGELTIEARINPADVDGIHTVVMYGDHGYGLYIDDGRLGYASEYSLSKNPLSDANISLPTDVWSTVAVALNASTGGTFFLNGAAIGTFDASEAEIPAGDFGSNDCYEADLACENLVIGRHGAGADRYHFHGMIDHVTISADDLRNMSDGNATLMTTTDATSSWTFGEGEGDQTMDASNRSATIHGAAWVMPDGSIVAQAMEVENGDELILEDISAGDTLLFFAELPQYTRDMSVQAFGWSSGNGKEEGDAEFSMYHDIDRVPSAWSHLDEVENWGWGGVYAAYSWPDAGDHWFVLQAEDDIDEFVLSVDWDVAEAPPTLDDMIELKHGIPVADQDLQSQRGSEFGDSIQYYVNVTEPLADLSVETYGGNGNVNLAISYGGPPDPFDQWGEWEIFGEPALLNEGVDPEAFEDWSTGPGNNEQVNLYNVEPGTYYITAFTWGQARDYSIVADLTPMPTNGEASDAIALTPGVPYGPFSGYDGLSQYFSIDVPDGTERLEVSLDDGLGEADLHLAYESTPTETVYDQRSTAPGANDRVAFNDPTPGTWMILVHTDRVFSGTTILAEFADRYVWDWDGEPIQLLNGEAIVGIEAEEGTVLEFFGILEEPASPLEVITWGDEGSIELEGEAEPYDWELVFEEGPRGRQWGEQSWSSGDGVAWTWYVDTAANGRFDVTVEVVDDVSGFGIIASWDNADLPPVDDDEDEDEDRGDEPFEPEGCEERTVEWFESMDRNDDGIVSLDEHQPHPSTGTPGQDLDANQDERLQMEELEADLCSCDQEFWFIWEQADEADAITVEDLEDVRYVNDIDVEGIDRDQDGDIDFAEAERHSLACRTTFDPLDLDGDGIPNEDDAFPEDPDESEDSDGDGVGDNADLVSGVNDSVVAYGAAAAVLGLIILLLLTMLRRGPGGDQTVDPWGELGDEKRMPELFETPPMTDAASTATDLGSASPEPNDMALESTSEVPSMADLPPPLNDAIPSEPLEWR